MEQIKVGDTVEFLTYHPPVPKMKGIVLEISTAGVKNPVYYIQPENKSYNHGKNIYRTLTENGVLS